ncbi:MAG: ComEC/Rec2 family competence protein [Phycisphaerae bacterium]
MLARRSQVDRTIDDAFRQTGNTHLLAASGLNVAWLVGLVWLIAAALRVDYRRRALIAAAVVGVYWIVVEPNPPILRAVLVSLLALAATLLGRRLCALNWLAAAAIALLLSNPGVLFSASFQFSFGVVLGLTQLAPRVLALGAAAWRALAGRAPFPDDALDGWTAPTLRAGGSPWSAAWRATRLAAAAAITAWLCGAPLAVYYFHQFSPWAPLTTLLLAPPTCVVMTVGFVKLFLGVLVPQSGAATGPLLDLLSRGLVAWVKLLARLPGSRFEPPAVSLAWVWACYAFLAAWAWLPRPAPHRSRPRSAAFALIAILLAAWPMLPLGSPRRTANTVRVWTLSIGNGLATVIELPGGRTLLFDCGSRSPYDAGRQVVVPFLRQRHIRRIDTAFVSHPDADHFGALLSVHASIPIRRVVLNEHFESFAADQPAALEFLAGLRAAAIPVETLSAGWQLDPPGADVDAPRVTALWPPPRGEFLPGDNSTSTVLRVSVAGRALLLTGDIDEFAQRALLERPAAELACDAVLLPHHGGMTAHLGEFLDATCAGVWVRSSGQHDAETFNGLIALSAGHRYFNTADAGCITLSLRADGVTVEPFVAPGAAAPRSTSAPAARYNPVRGR